MGGRDRLQKLVESIFDAGKLAPEVVEEGACSRQIAFFTESFQFAQGLGECLYAAGNAGSDQFVGKARDLLA